MMIRAFIAITAFVVVAYLIMSKSARIKPQREIKPPMAILPPAKSLFSSFGLHVDPIRDNDPKVITRREAIRAEIEKRQRLAKAHRLVNLAKENGYDQV